MTEERRYELIEKSIESTLSDEEKRELELLKVEDPSINDDIENFKILVKGIRKSARQEFKKKIGDEIKKSREVESTEGKFFELEEPVQRYSKVDKPEEHPSQKEPRKIAKFIPYSIAAILAIIFIVWQPHKLSNEILFTRYVTENVAWSQYKAEIGLVPSDIPGERGIKYRFEGFTIDESKVLSEAIRNYGDKNYALAEKAFSQILKNDTRSLPFLFVYSITLANTDNVNKAIETLVYLNSLQNQEHVEYFLALCYLEQDQKIQSQKLLKEIIQKEGKYSEQAQIILNKMKWF